MNNKKISALGLKVGLVSALGLGLTLPVVAHDVWIGTGSFEIHSDEQNTFSIDLSRSAEPFVAESNHETGSMNIVGPKGEKKEYTPAFSGKNKEVYEAEFKEYGTYYLNAAETQVFLTFYKDEEGKKHKIRMPKSQYSTLPKGSTPVRTVEKRLASESYISFNGMSKISKDIRKEGVTIIPNTHPSKIETNEPFSFTIYVDGVPMEKGEVALKSLNRIYYDDYEKVEIEEGKDGIYEFEVKYPGRYLLGVEMGSELSGEGNADSLSQERFLTFDIKQN
ncbi:MAG: putative GH25 family protein [Oleispira sp.]|jgi:uncharacterized GH25 family protein